MWRCYWKQKEEHRHLGWLASTSICLTPVSVLSPLKGFQTNNSGVPIYCAPSCYSGTTPLSSTPTYESLIHFSIKYPVVCNFVRWTPESISVEILWDFGHPVLQLLSKNKQRLITLKDTPSNCLYHYVDCFTLTCQDYASFTLWGLYTRNLQIVS